LKQTRTTTESEEKDSSFSEEKEAKRLFIPGAGSKVRDLAGKYLVLHAFYGWTGRVSCYADSVLFSQLS
jgi:hypothetical protein